MANSIQFAGEFILDKCELISSAGVSADLSKIIAEINIFEDIFSNALTGSIIITDTNNLVDNMPIIGQEYISLKITTPSMEQDSIDFTENVFCVYEMGGRTPAGTNSEVVELKICSPELLRNHRTRISKAYEQTVDQIVKSIMENEIYINTKKDLYLEPTLGIRKILSPGFHPYHLIKQLTKESVSAKNNSPHYLFFENINGFHFRSIQSLYEDGVQQHFHFGDKGTDELYSSKSGEAGRIVQAFKRMINYSVPSKNNSLLDIKGGMLGANLIMHDIYNKKYHASTFSYFDDHDQHKRIDKGGSPKYNNVLIDEKNTVGDFTASRLHLHPTSTTTDDRDAQYIRALDKAAQGEEVSTEEQDENKDYMSNRADKWLLQRRQRIHELTNGMTINMTVHGNTTLTVGQVIEVSLPVFGTDHENTKISKHQSGLYLINKLRHTFNPPTRVHTVSLQATKDSYPIEFESKASGKEPKQVGMPTVYQI
jgi:hypothetical protein